MSAKFQKREIFFNISKEEFLSFMGLQEEDLLEETVGENPKFWMYPATTGTPPTYCYDNDCDSIRMYRDMRMLGEPEIRMKKFIYWKAKSRTTGEVYPDGRYTTRNWITWKRFI